MGDVKLYGTSQVEPEPVHLAAGPLIAEFVAGALRTICFDGVEVLRGISYVSRNKNWGTNSARLTDVNIEQSNRSFSITFKSEISDGAQSLTFENFERLMTLVTAVRKATEQVVSAG
jgi:hypothetical protein